QVHPDRETVKRLVPEEGSKTEAWFVLEATPDSRVWAGLNPGVDEAKLRTALAEKSVVECLHSFVPKAGDCIFLPAGDVRAGGRGSGGGLGGGAPARSAPTPGTASTPKAPAASSTSSRRWPRSTGMPGR